MTLGARDLRSVLSYVTDVLSVDEYADVPTRMLPGLARLIGAESTALTHLDVGTQHEVTLFWPSAGTRLDLLAGYAEVAASHPLRQPLLRLSGRTGGCPRAGVGAAVAPLCVSDLLGSRAWRETPIQREVLRDVTDQMWLPLAVRGRNVHAVTLSRTHGTFTDRQRHLLAACASHLRAALARARRTSGVGLQLSPELEWVSLSGAPGVSVDRQPILHGGSPGPARPRLSPRELEVLALVAKGLTDAQIARRLDVRPATVSKHLNRVYTRHGVANRAAAVGLWSRQASLLPDQSDRVVTMAKPPPADPPRQLRTHSSPRSPAHLPVLR